MRIIAGTLKGRTFDTPKGMDTRPTLDRVKEALFGMIQFEIFGRNVLDLFSGSGNLGLEAMSRGAKYAVFNDSSRECAELIKKNIAALGLAADTSVTSLNYTDALNLYKRQGRSFDIIFLDPPYASGFASEALEKIAALELLSTDGLIVVEHDRQNGLKLPDGIGLVKERSYGKVVISLLRRLQDD